MLCGMGAPTVRSVLLAAALALAGCSLLQSAGAQDPGRDLPARRVAGVIEQQALELGVQRLRAGWYWEAARMFRELLVADPQQPLPHLLLALAMRDVPNRAARHCFDAVSRRFEASQAEQQLLAAYQAYFGVTDQPELQDQRFQQEPAKSRAEQLVATLEKLRGDGAFDKLAQQLWHFERERLAEPAQPFALTPIATEGAALLRHYNQVLASSNQMPFQVPGYERVLGLVTLQTHAVQLAERLPRHPQHAFRRRRFAKALPGFPGIAEAAPAGDAWQPRVAPGFDLPRGGGGRSKFADYNGKPVLVIFFLGFGCVHCVAQLSDLDPKAPKFRAAGIEVVTIGTDDLNAVKASRQAAAENGVDPLHFDVLCDPEAKVFKQWGCWDEFSNEALHGSFLVDGQGRILWQDISARPFEESDWLLAESQRLLTAWR